MRIELVSIVEEKKGPNGKPLSPFFTGRGEMI